MQISIFTSVCKASSPKTPATLTKPSGPTASTPPVNSGAPPNSSLPRRLIRTASSATRRCPREISSSVSSDLPVPDAPRIRDPRLKTASSTPWMVRRSTLFSSVIILQKHARVSAHLTLKEISNEKTRPLRLRFDQPVVPVFTLIDHRNTLVIGIAKDQKVLVLFLEQHCRLVHRHRLDLVTIRYDDPCPERRRADLIPLADDGARPLCAVRTVDDLFLEFERLFLDLPDRLRDRLVHVRRAAGGSQDIVPPIERDLAPVARPLHIKDDMGLD